MRWRYSLLNDFYSITPPSSSLQSSWTVHVVFNDGFQASLDILHPIVWFNSPSHLGSLQIILLLTKGSLLILTSLIFLSAFFCHTWGVLLTSYWYNPTALICAEQFAFVQKVILTWNNVTALRWDYTEPVFCGSKVALSFRSHLKQGHILQTGPSKHGLT